MSSTVPCARHASPGFSLVEVLTALSLFGVISAVAASNFVAYMPGYRVRGAALQIAGDMNKARFSAIKEGKQYYYVPQAGTSYKISYADGLGGQTDLKTVDVAANYPGVQFGVTGIGSDPYGTAGPAAVPAGTITFNSDGTVSNAAGVYIEPTTSGGHVQHGVTVTAGGRIRVWHYDGSAWK